MRFEFYAGLDGAKQGEQVDGGGLMASAHTASATWTGAGGNNYWTTNANWRTGGRQSGGAIKTDCDGATFRFTFVPSFFSAFEVMV